MEVGVSNAMVESVEPIAFAGMDDLTRSREGPSGAEVGCPWRRPFQQTQVELSRGFGAMGKVISRMAVREPGRSNARTGKLIAFAGMDDLTRSREGPSGAEVGCPWRRPFRQTQVELSRGFGAMGKVISRMAVREPGRSNAAASGRQRAGRGRRCWARSLVSRGTRRLHLSARKC